MSDNPLLDLITGSGPGPGPGSASGRGTGTQPLSPTTTAMPHHRMQGLFNLSNPSLPPNASTLPAQQPRAFSAFGLPLLSGTAPSSSFSGAAASSATAGAPQRGVPGPGSMSALQGLVATAAQGRTQNPALLGLLGGTKPSSPSTAAPTPAPPADAFPVGTDGDASLSFNAPAPAPVTNGRHLGSPANASTMRTPRPTSASSSTGSKSPTRRRGNGRQASKSPARSTTSAGGPGNASPTSTGTGAATLGQRTSRSSSVSSNATNNTVVSASVLTMPPPPASAVTSPTSASSSFSYTNPFLVFEHLGGGGPGSQSVKDVKGANKADATGSMSMKSDPGVRVAPAAAAMVALPPSRSSTPGSTAANKQGGVNNKKQAAAAGVGSSKPARAPPLSPRHAKPPAQQQKHAQARASPVDPSALLDSDTPQELATLRPLSPARVPAAAGGASTPSSSSVAGTPTSPAGAAAFAAAPSPWDITPETLASLAQSARPDTSSRAPVFLLRAPPASGSTPAPPSAARLVHYIVGQGAGAGAGGLHAYPVVAKSPADLVPVHVGVGGDGAPRAAHAGVIAQSSDGTCVAFVTPAGQVVVVDVAARQPLSVLGDDAAEAGHDAGGRGSKKRKAVAIAMLPKLIAVAYDGGKVQLFKIKRKEGSVVKFGEVQVVLGGHENDQEDEDEDEDDAHPVIVVQKVHLLPSMQLVALVDTHGAAADDDQAEFAQYLVKVDVAGMANASANGGPGSGTSESARAIAAAVVRVDLAQAPSIADDDTLAKSAGSAAADVGMKKLAVQLDSTRDDPVTCLALSTMSPFYITCTRSGADLKLWQNLAPARNVALAGALAKALGTSAALGDEHKGGEEEEGAQATAVSLVGVHSVAHTDAELVLALATASDVAIVTVSRAKTKAHMSATVVAVVQAAGHNRFTRISGCTSGAQQHHVWLQCDTLAGVSSGGLLGYDKYARGMGPVAILTLAPSTWLPTKFARVPLPEYPSADPLIGWSVKGNSLVVATEVAGLWAGSVDSAVVLLGGNAGFAEAVVPEVKPPVTVQVVSGSSKGGSSIKSTPSSASVSSMVQQQQQQQSQMHGSPPVQQQQQDKDKTDSKGTGKRGPTAPAGNKASSRTVGDAHKANTTSNVVLQRSGSGSGSGRTRTAVNNNSSSTVRASPVASPTTPAQPMTAGAFAGISEAQLNVLLDARFAQFTAQLEADRAARQAAEAERHAQLVRSLTQTLTDTLDKAISLQVQAVIVPAVSRQVAEQVEAKLSAMTKDQFKQQAKHVQQDVVRACQQVVVDKLVPAYEHATQEMFRQVAETFQAGVDAMVEAVVVKVSEQVAVHLQEAGQKGTVAFVQSASSGEEEEQSEEEEGEEEQVDEQGSESEEDDEFANAAEFNNHDRHQRLASSSPSPTSAAALQPASAFASFDDYLHYLVANGAWEQALREAMSSPDSLGPTWNLIAAYPSPPSKDLADLISQPVMIGVLVTLAHQLSVVAADEAVLEARVQWMQALVNSLDIEDPVVSSYVGQFLAQAITEVTAVEQVLVQNMRAGKRSAYLPAVGLLLRTLKSTLEMVVKV